MASKKDADRVAAKKKAASAKSPGGRLATKWMDAAFGAATNKPSAKRKK
jgi:hypothetical protein